ncbi:hypothetical protein [Thermococcus sp.]|uniref:hypothetical protein n=1 Tax=Thermococcus sp. TaxID=35749 RepID=UPI0026220925|nr:hypothetical protein [Thermococcus sp.]
MRRAGFVFTLDALLSLIIVFVVVTSVLSVEENTFQVYSSVMRMKTVYTAEDMITILSTVPLESLVNDSVIENWTETGVLNTSLFISPEMPPLKIALTYWALSNISKYHSLNLTSKAGKILKYVITHNFQGYGFELDVNSTKLVSFGNPSSARDVTVATTVMSGFKRGRKPLGYVSRAYLTYAQHTYSQLIGIQRIVAAGWDNTIQVDIPVDLPEDAGDITAEGAFYARIVPNNDITLTVVSSAGQVTENLNSGGTVDLSDYLKPGHNVLKFSIDSGNADEVGFGSGSVLLVSYHTNTTSHGSPDKINLYDVTSYYGFVQFLTIVPTGNVTGINIYLKASGVSTVHVYYSNGTSICDTGLSKGFVDNITYFSSSEVENGLEECGVSYSDLNKKSFTLVLGFDATWPSGSSNPDYDWTYRERHLYGDGQSFVQVEVNSKVNSVQYAIPLAEPLYPDNFTYSGYLFSSRDDRIYDTMSVSYPLPPKAIPWYSDYWVAIMYRGNPTGTLQFKENGITIREGPLDYYLYRFGYSKYYRGIMVNGTTNTLVASSSSSAYGFRKGKSWGAIYYFLQAYAPYGRMFPELIQGYPTYKGYNLTYYAKLYGTNMHPKKMSILVGKEPYMTIDVTELNPERYAVDDAILRLFKKLAVDDSGIPGSADNPLGVLLPPYVNMEFSAMKAPSLFVPVSVSLKVWRLG